MYLGSKLGKFAICPQFLLWIQRILVFSHRYVLGSIRSPGRADWKSSLSSKTSPIFLSSSSYFLLLMPSSPFTYISEHLIFAFWRSDSGFRPWLLNGIVQGTLKNTDPKSRPLRFNRTGPRCGPGTQMA